MWKFELNLVFVGINQNRKGSSRTRPAETLVVEDFWLVEANQSRFVDFGDLVYFRFYLVVPFGLFS